MFEGITMEERSRIVKVATILLAMIAVFFLFKVVEQVRTMKYLGGVPMYNTITVRGEGEVFAVADTATVTYTYSSEAASVKEAQDVLNEKMNAAILKINEIGVEEGKVKTISFVSTPKYKYEGYTMWPSYEQEIVGYRVEQTNEVKISDTELVEPILAALAEIGDFRVNGPTFEVGDTDALEEEARALAIKDAKEEAEVLAKELGVRIVRVSSYYDESDGGYYPMYDSYGMGEMAAADMVKAAPALEAGEDKISKSVSVTFEIR